MDSIIQKLVGDLVKGAAQAEGFMRGSRMRVDLGGDLVGQKFANHAGLGGALAGPIGAAIGADPGQGLSAAGGSLLGGAGGAFGGGLAGGGIGMLLARLLGRDAIAGGQLGSLIGTGVGGLAGSAYGGHKGGEGRSLVDKLSAAAVDGVKAAAARFGVKEAFLPLLAAAGEIAGPALARAGLGSLAEGAGGKMLGGVAGKLMPHIGGGVGGAAFNQLTSAAGGALGQHMQRPQPQPHPGMMG